MFCWCVYLHFPKLVQLCSNPEKSVILIKDTVCAIRSPSPVSGVSFAHASGLRLSVRSCNELTFYPILSQIFTIHFLDLGHFKFYVYTRWRILVIRCLDLKLSEKQAKQTLAAAQLQALPYWTASEKHWFLMWNCFIKCFYQFKSPCPFVLVRSRPLCIIRLQPKISWRCGS